MNAMIDRRQLEHLLTITQAAGLLHVDEEDVLQRIREGVLWAAVLPDGSLGVSQSSVSASLPRDELPDYKDFLSLKGQPISISDASRKYGLNTSTLTRWMQRGYIARIGKDGRRTLLDEADAAYCARVYLSDSGQGKWQFDAQGKPAEAGGRRKRRQSKPE